MGENTTHRLLRLLDTGLNLLKGILDLILDKIYLMFADYGDGGLGGELFRARPPHTPVPSHTNFGARDRPLTMGWGTQNWYQ